MSEIIEGGGAEIETRAASGSNNCPSIEDLYDIGLRGVSSSNTKCVSFQKLYEDYHLSGRIWPYLLCRNNYHTENNRTKLITYNNLLSAICQGTHFYSPYPLSSSATVYRSAINSLPYSNNISLTRTISTCSYHSNLGAYFIGSSSTLLRYTLTKSTTINRICIILRGIRVSGGAGSTEGHNRNILTICSFDESREENSYDKGILIGFQTSYSLYFRCGSNTPWRSFYRTEVPELNSDEFSVVFYWDGARLITMFYKTNTLTGLGTVTYNTYSSSSTSLFGSSDTLFYILFGHKADLSQSYAGYLWGWDIYLE